MGIFRYIFEEIGESIRRNYAITHFGADPAISIVGDNMIRDLLGCHQQAGYVERQEYVTRIEEIMGYLKRHTSKNHFRAELSYKNILWKYDYYLKNII